MNLPETLRGLEHLSGGVILLDGSLLIAGLNPAAENLFGLSDRQIRGLPLESAFVDAGSLRSAVASALHSETSFTEHELELESTSHLRHAVSCTATPVRLPPVRLLLELHPLDSRLRIDREERQRQEQTTNRMLIGNLAHEIKNPLGGIRGAAQLLAAELPHAGLQEYTQVIISEVDRLRTLVDRLLTPHRLPQYADINIHEVLERVRSLVIAEGRGEIVLRRDYDTSLPELHADREQLIQVFLNIVRNAVQALNGRGEIILRTRVARQLTLAKKRHRLALQVQVIDNGPGIPTELQEKIFAPLVSGRDGGSGLGLTLAQTFVSAHQGIIDLESQPGHTCFTVLLPLHDLT